MKDNVELFELIDINYDKNIRDYKALLSYIRLLKEINLILANEDFLKLNKIGKIKNV